MSEFEDRKRLTFEQAEGVAPLPRQLRSKELSPELRALLWVEIHESLQESQVADIEGMHFADPWDRIFLALHVLRDHQMIDEFENDYEELTERTKDIIVKGDYIAVFGWIQWVLRRPDCPKEFAQNIDRALTRARAAYRVLDRNTIVPLGSEAEGKAIERAFTDLAVAEFHGANAHLRKAAEYLSAGHYADSVWESIHAVESVVRVLDSTGDFSKALAKLEAKFGIHGALKKGFTSLYGFTSDEKGIRHPLLDDGAARVDETDALFMMGACSAFTSYLINKARVAGLLKAAKK
jgi:hypothetical protein